MSSYDDQSVREPVEMPPDHYLSRLMLRATIQNMHCSHNVVTSIV